MSAGKLRYTDSLIDAYREGTIQSGSSQELENKITQIEKHEAERREQEERKHKEEAPLWKGSQVFPQRISELGDSLSAEHRILQFAYSG